MTGYLQESKSAVRKATTAPALMDMKLAGEKIAMLTCYDASFASMMDRCGIDMLLIGDSLGNVLQGQTTTLPVTLEDVAYHTACVSRGNRSALVAADMPFGTYGTPESAFEGAVRLMQAGAQMIKLEGGAWLVETVKFLTERSIPVCAHLGLTPQSVHRLGGFKVQAKKAEDVERLKADAVALQEAGASLMLIEAIPATVGKELTDLLQIPTIGIGAGPDCSGQVLVMHDMLGIFPGKTARFVRNFMDGMPSIEAAIGAYIKAVKSREFPAPEHCF
ncbi:MULTISPECIES: 3-methyl-2-oxobutanoate hydroxymethyltransferase [Paraburkholderia]|jgi:3-methyl-2-oxobutanoate hydroxymethyltransferase|uniref:3-methyl-2-oxobutanoate hydroxymethyltransferase n=1 Tax=Paraburkholderia phenazinium TaxID=60549 RepID=A0A1N6JD31_9BURK|nr:3-methyl-2-oxobutanoate hydroxymethyltransferase [Paraburkholderia phenazinium]SIO42258.1 ketopantoate hydroxymethyltransferase [Paraburkholderia phenazinium]SIO49943.1 ketopantoate hydroxymethyltransferase [Paraburkholderia phenazinium]